MTDKNSIFWNYLFYKIKIEVDRCYFSLLKIKESLTRLSQPSINSTPPIYVIKKKPCSLVKVYKYKLPENNTIPAIKSQIL